MILQLVPAFLAQELFGRGGGEGRLGFRVESSAVLFLF